jgi:hypothetical protein
VSGIFTDTIDTVSASLTALGLKPVTDSRNARPLTVFVELPTFTCFNNQIADITVDLRVLGAPPGNQDASDYIQSTGSHLRQSIHCSDRLTRTTRIRLNNQNRFQAHPIKETP